MYTHRYINHQFSSVAQSCLTLCDPMNRSTPGLPVHHQLPEFTQSHVESVMPSNHLILSSPPPPAPSLSLGDCSRGFAASRGLPCPPYLNVWHDWSINLSPSEILHILLIFFLFGPLPWGQAFVLFIAVTNWVVYKYLQNEWMDGRTHESSGHGIFPVFIWDL